MTILALDLTSEFGSVAIRRDGGTLVQHGIESRTGFAHLVFPALDNLLADAGLSLSAIDCFAASTGPGAFTGLRVALAAVKGLAVVTGKPVLGVSKLRAMASFGAAPERLVLLDARRGEAFAAVYNDRLELIQEETVTKAEQWLADLPGGGLCELITADAEWLRQVVTSTPYESTRCIETPHSLAAAVAQCAEADLRRGATGDPATLDANYVRRSDAELYWTEN